MKKVWLTWHDTEGELRNEVVDLLESEEPLFTIEGDEAGITVDDLATMAKELNWVLFEDEWGLFGVEADKIISIEEV